MPKNDASDVSLEAGIANREALKSCILKANSTEDRRTVVIPKDYAFSSLDLNISDLHDVTL